MLSSFSLKFKIKSFKNISSPFLYLCVVLIYVDYVLIDRNYNIILARTDPFFCNGLYLSTFIAFKHTKDANCK